MATIEKAEIRIQVEPFDEEAFKAFGRAVLHPGEPERHDIADAFTNLPASTAKAWVNNPQPVTLPLTLRKIERHPHSAQTFIPLENASYVAIACLSDADGAPLPETLRAFRVNAPVGVQYRQGVWHHGMILLEKPANFVVLMSFNGLPTDEFRPLPYPIEVFDA